MLFRFCTRRSTYFCFECCGLNEKIIKLVNERIDNFWFCPDCVKCDFLDKDIDERSQYYLETVEPRLQNLQNSNKSVLDKIKNSILNTTFNDLAEKNKTR